MKESLRSTLRSAFFEALFVVFGVALALAANEWRQNVKARELAGHMAAGHNQPKMPPVNKA